MSNPAELMRRAAQTRQRAAVRQPEAAKRPEPAAEPQPRPQARHANYSALMRSHDRVRTCHLSGKS